MSASADRRLILGKTYVELDVNGFCGLGIDGAYHMIAGTPITWINTLTVLEWYAP